MNSHNYKKKNNNKNMMIIRRRIIITMILRIEYNLNNNYDETN